MAVHKHCYISLKRTQQGGPRRRETDRGKPAIHLNEEPAIVVRKMGSASHLPPQNDQLMSKCRILSLKPLFDLNGEASAARTKQISATVAPT
jgi:hypothetical protein